jgi:hypothetical protein
LEEPKNDSVKKKSRLRKLLRWLIVDVLVAAILILLLLYRPSGYRPPHVVTVDANGREIVNPYVSQDLGPRFNNGAQERKPFHIKLEEKAFNEVIARYKWPQEAAGVSLSSPQVSFEPGRITLMGTATMEHADFIVTVDIEPQFDDKGLLNLNVTKVKVGAMNITPLAKMIGKQKYEERLDAGAVDMDDIRTRITGSLLAGKSFDPVIESGGKRIRLKSLDITQGHLDAEFVPAK